MIKVLLVDDEKDFGYLLKRNLEITGKFQVLYTPNGREGVEIAKKEKPDIIILDLIMPDIGGEETAALLKQTKETTSIPVIFLTMIVDKKNFEEVTSRSKEYKFLAKPVTPDGLIEVIEHVLSTNLPPHE